MENTNEYYYIRTAEDLSFLRKVKSFFYRYNSVKFEIDSIDNQLTTEWENKINRYYKACGCGEGKSFVLIFFLAGMGKLYLEDAFYFSLSHFTSVFLMCLLGAFIGKAYGKFRAFLRLRKVIGEIESDVAKNLQLTIA